MVVSSRVPRTCPVLMGDLTAWGGGREGAGYSPQSEGTGNQPMDRGSLYPLEMPRAFTSKEAGVSSPPSLPCFLTHMYCLYICLYDTVRRLLSHRTGLRDIYPTLCVVVKRERGGGARVKKRSKKEKKERSWNTTQIPFIKYISLLKVKGGFMLFCSTPPSEPLGDILPTLGTVGYVAQSILDYFV